MDLTNLSKEERQDLMRKLQEEEQKDASRHRERYEVLRKETVEAIRKRVEQAAADTKDLFAFIKGETMAFYSIMNEYGQLAKEGQMNYTLTDGKFKIEVKTNKVKKFDERADLAASRLVEFLKGWIKNSSKGADDPMYQLAMNMLSRNRDGDLDYKSISKLYELEDKFADAEYSSIMSLFKESNKVDSTTTNFYFSRKNDMGVWKKVEISFNRM